MHAITEFSGRLLEIDYATSTLLIRYEGMPPDIPGKTVNIILTGPPVVYQHCYPDGTWRVNHGEPIDGMRPVASRPLYAPL